jgi:menaquinone-dependent protoporphyrinogen oxidase
MKVLVSAASKYGATSQIAEEIGRVLREALDDRSLGSDFVVDVRPPEEVGSFEDYDAVVLGSAVYAGHWLAPAKDLVARDAATLATRPVWLFSSGPIGAPPKPTDPPVDLTSVIAATGARDHRIFPGRLDRADLGLAERAIAAALRAPQGDFRPWEEIRDWAAGIANALTASPSHAG